MQYQFFCRADRPWDPIIYNTRVYSCILINNEIEPRWRVLEWEGKDAPFNEDTDLALQVLKQGYCTIMFNSFLSGKMATMVMKGGNTDNVYKVAKEGFDNRYSFAASLKKAHPDCVDIQQRWGRWHHDVDYSRFQRENVPILRSGVDVNLSYPHKLKLVKVDENGNQSAVNVEDLKMEIEYE